MQHISYIYLTQAEQKRLQTLERRYRNAARSQFTARVQYYHQFTGGIYTSITIRDQMTHMNHSKDFWNMVAEIMPEYKVYKTWLREHGQKLNLITYLERQGIPVKL